MGEVKLCRRVGVKGSGTGQYSSGFTHGGKESNDYEWACVICNKVYSFRQAAIECCRKEKEGV